MRSIILVLAALLACASAQIPVTDLTNGVAVHYNFPAAGDVYVTERTTKQFRMFIPTNVLVVNVTSYTNDYVTCYHGYVKVSGGRGQTCNVASGDYPSNGVVPCDDYYFTTGGYSGTQFGTGDDGQVSDLSVGSWWYFGVNKYTADYNHDCPMTIVVAYTTCPAGHVGVGQADVAVCIPVTAVTTGNWFAAGNITDVDNGEAYSVNFATEQNSVQVVCNTTDVDLEISGQSGRATLHTDAHCYNSESNGQAILLCNTVPAGTFYFTLQTSNPSGGSTICQVTSTTCNSGSGVGCSGSLTQYVSGTSYTRSIQPLTPTPTELINQNFYVDFPANSTGTLNLTFTCVGSGDGRINFRKNSYAWYYSYAITGYNYGNDFSEEETTLDVDGDSVNYYLRTEDLWSGGRFYWSACQWSFSDFFNFTLTANNVGPVTGSSTGAAAATTGVQTTTGVQSTTGVQTTTGVRTTTGIQTTTGSAAATTGPHVTTGAAAAATTAAKVTTGGSGAASLVPALFLVAMMLALVF